ncbi:MAG TPA: UPF0182 family protein [Syntrophomonas sp.]|jgi:hypothetical protein|nr:UPF0182 family protein [Syntrophomonas sp.]
MNTGSLKSTIKIILILVAIGVISTLAKLYSDWLWFQAVDFSSAFTTIIMNKAGLYAVLFIFAFVLLYINLSIARKGTGIGERPPETDDGREIIYLNPEKSPLRKFMSSRSAHLIMLVVSILGALMVSSVSADNWIIIQQYLHRVPFGTTDPVFHKDIGFYVFNLSFYKFVYGTLMMALVLTTVLTGVVYLLDASFDLIFADWQKFTFGKSHIAVLIALIIALKAWGYKLASYGILVSNGGLIYGASYTDVHARLLAYRILMVVALLVALVVILNIFVKRLRWVAYSIGAWLVLSIALTGIYPVIIQKVVVQPNEFNREKTYIQRSIKATREAYMLDKADNRQFNIAYNLTMSDLQNQTTIENTRLWDWQPLTDTYRSLQELRPYYVFNDLDIDRYIIDGKYRQVMLSARELERNNLPDRAKTWINQRLMYTHGYGVAMSPVNEIAQEGFPTMFIKDIPPQFSTDLTLKRPEIYFGESTNDYVIVNTKQKEFDYPMGTQNMYTNYKGQNGVKVNSFGRRLLMAWVLKDYKIILSSDITNSSQILYNRNIVERISKIAPYLEYDQDPYIVIGKDGKLYWMLDAYTYTNKYPYSEPFDNQGNNYIRNSVKVVCDAYSGQMDFYVADPTDPIIKSYARIFPKVYQPLSAMPEALKAHVRYPVDIFTIQANLYRTFHMTDPYVFYNKEDNWVIPSEIVEGKETKVDPYYIIMRLPGETKAEYILMLPYTPNSRPNMIAWMCVRMDGDEYGKMLVYNFPKQATVYGPMQIEARISQDTEISRQLTLWDQKGSQTYRGNLIVIPIDNSILYIEPLYLQAQSSKMPELKRVIAAYGNEVVMEPSLDEALIKLFGESPPKTPGTTTTQENEVAGNDIKQLAQQARDYYDSANELLRQGDWAGYGNNINKLNEVIKRMEEIAGK